MASPSIKRTSVFICYSHNHKDARFFDQLVEHLAYFERNNQLKVWSDKKITPGTQWREEIRQAIESTSVAVLLISPSFLASKFIADNELPPLLRAAEKEGANILPIIVRPSYFEDTELANFQALNNPSKPVAGMKGYERDALWTKVVREIKKAVNLQQQSNPVIGNLHAETDVLIQTSLQTHSPSVPPIDEQVSLWMQEKELKKNSTGRSYAYLMKDFREALNEQGLDLNSQDASALVSFVTKWANTTVKGSKVASNTYQTRVSTIRSFYSYAVAQGWIETNPLVTVEKREIVLVNGAKALDFEKVKAGLKKIPRKYLPGKRDYALLCILLTCGLHVSELTGLRCGDIDITDGKVTITYKQKGGIKKEQSLLQATAQALTDYLTMLYSNGYTAKDPVWVSFARNEYKG